MPNRRLHRRAVLAGVAALATATLARPVSPAARGVAPRRVDAALRHLFRNRRSAAAVGRAYLAQTPQEADPRRLIALLARDHPDLVARLHAGGAVPLRRAAQQGLSADFAARRTVWVRGWLLARTEARLCALRCFTA